MNEEKDTWEAGFMAAYNLFTGRQDKYEKAKDAYVKRHGAVFSYMLMAENELKEGPPPVAMSRWR